MAADFVLDPYQQALERQNIAKQAFAQHILNTRAPEPQPNPFITGSDAGLTQVAAPAAPAQPATPNVLIQPPVPISTMSTTQQMAWQQHADALRAHQIETEKNLLAIDEARRKSELDHETVTQSRAMMKELPALHTALAKEGKLDDYLAMRADLQTRFPAGSGDASIQRALGAYDTMYNNLSKIEEARRTAEINRREGTLQKRKEAGFEQAKELGPEAIARFGARVDADPEGAIGEVAALAQANEMRNTIATLVAGGMTPQQIEQDYGGGQSGRPFAYGAAAGALKAREALTQDTARIGALFTNLNKQRAEAEFKPDYTTPDAEAKAYARTHGKWSRQSEALYEQAYNDYNAALARGGGQRGGVQGMPVVGAVEGGSIYKGYAQPIGTAPAVVTPAVVTAPPEPVGTTKLVNNVPYVKYPDGQWYKIKQK